MQLFRRILKLNGKDSTTFLNSLCTNTLKEPITYGLFLSPQSRVLLDAFYFKLNNEAYLDIHEPFTDVLLSHIRKYKLRNDIELTSVHGSVHWHKDFTTTTGTLFKDPRPLMGYRSIIVDKKEPVVLSDAHEYTLHRYQQGIPEPSDVLNTLPFDLNLDIVNAVDYTKGCYTGQELLIRTKHIGVVRKRAICFKINNASQYNTNDLKGESVTVNDKSIGKIINYIRNKNTLYGLCIIKLNKFEQSAVVRDCPVQLHLPSYINK